MDRKTNLLDLNYAEIENVVKDYNLPKYRAKQIYSWLYKGISSFDEMRNIPKDLIKKLSSDYEINKINIYKKLSSRIDDTVKYIFKLWDGNLIESVFMSYKHGNTICVSSQVGCKMGCKFCASTKSGFVRNLTSGEIIDQIMAVEKDLNVRISNIVMMGIGEPLDNYDNVIKFIRNVNNPEGLGIGMRHISVSTCGIVDKIYDLLDENIPITLSISLHAPNDAIRGKIMPINATYSIDKLIEACKIYTKDSRRRITFEYSLISGINDSKDNANELVKLLKGMMCHVNLIPINEIDESDLKQSSKNSIELFKTVLYSKRIEVTIRRKLGVDIDAACGQLRTRLLK